MTISVAVTGAAGFVGSALLKSMTSDPLFRVRALYRQLPYEPPKGVQYSAVGNLEDSPDLSLALTGVDVLVHAAARAHIIVEAAGDPIGAYHRANVAATQKLFDAAVRAKVKRFVFLSSVAVHGESTPMRRPFTETDAPNPTTAYGVSKATAENRIWLAARMHPIEIVILRPPLVYGPGVKGNMLRLIRLIDRGIPLPLANVSNLRSMIGIENLVSAILTATCHRAAAGHTFLVSDQHDVSTPELVQILASALGRPARLFPMPSSALWLAGRLTGRSSEVRRLTQSMVIDSQAMTARTGWRPADNLRETLERTARQVIAARS